MQAAREFLQHIIDYAGLFPPASLGMDDAVRAYSDYLAGPDSDLLGRFIVPVQKLDGLSASLGRVPVDDGTWHVSVIAGSDYQAALEASLAFNQAMSLPGGSSRAVCDAVEVRAPDADAARRIIDCEAHGFAVFVEIPVSPDPSPVIEVLRGSRAAAKIRTGGITADAFPSSVQVLRFMLACREHDVPFKATAGLHHMVRAHYPFTYDEDSPVGEMFGYLNIFIAAAALHAGWQKQDVLAIIEAADASRFRFDANGAVVSGRRISREQLSRARGEFALSFGSCSFTEPVGEARESGLV